MARGALRPAAGKTALVVVDMINDLSFEGADTLREGALSAAKAIAALRDAADAAGVPTIYVNDNHDEWHSERSRLVDRCLADGSVGAEMVRRVAPRADDFFVIKPQFSGFYATNLPVLLPRLEVSRLILTGIAADICILFTAADAHMRAYDLWVPRDAVAAEDPARTGWALDIMAKSMDAETARTKDLPLADWIARAH